MHHTCLPYSSPMRTFIHADHRTYLQLNNYMTSRRTHHEPTLTLTEWHSTPNIFKMIQPILSRVHQISISAQQTGCTTPLCKLNYLLTEIKCSSRSRHFTSTWSLTLHLYVKSNSLPLREVQISFRCQFSRTQIHQIASYGLHHQIWLRLCGCLHTMPKGPSHP